VMDIYQPAKLKTKLGNRKNVIYRPKNRQDNGAFGIKVTTAADHCDGTVHLVLMHDIEDQPMQQTMHDLQNHAT
jgi:hypothetical protein